MFLMYSLLPSFEAADSGGSGGGEETSPAGEQQPEGGGDNAEKKSNGKDVEDEFFGNDAATILKDAPVIDPKTGDPIDQSKKSEEPGKDAKTEQQTDKSASDKYKLDDQEYTAEQIREWKKDSESKSEWSKNYTQKGQILSYVESMPPEAQKAFHAHAVAEAYAKKDPKEYLEQGEAKDLVFTIEEDGEDIEQRISPGTEEYKVFEDHFEQLFLKKYEPAFVALKTHMEAQKSFNEEQERFYKQTSQEKYVKAINKYPQIGFRVEKNADLQEQLQTAVDAGDTHPLFRGAQKVYSLLQGAQSLGMEFEAYLDMVYGEDQAKKSEAQKILEKDKQNQEAGTSQEPGKGAPSNLDFVDRLNQTGGNSHEDLVADFDKGKQRR